MRIVFHAGMGKTGTSSLQATFAKNRTLLASAGIIYPKLDAAASHRLLITLAKPHMARPRGLEALSETDWLAAADQVKAALRDAAAKHPKVLLLSTEYAFGFSKEGHGRVRTVLDELTEDITVAVWLRDPIEYYRSYINQFDKHPNRNRPRPDPHTFTCKFRMILNRLHSVWDNVAVNLYDPRASITDDFIRRALPEAAELPLVESRKNISSAPSLPDGYRSLLERSCRDDYAVLRELELTTPS